MRVLVACEFSGIVRDAFIAAGHDAMSVDLIPSERPGPHRMADAIDTAYGEPWDMMIAHAPCTYTAVSGARWMAGRRQQTLDAILFVRALLAAPIPRIALENPVSILSSTIAKPTQIVQPWMFGHPETKATCLWLAGLPPLIPTDDVRAVMDGLPLSQRTRVHYASPGPDRWKERSRTLPGLAAAMAAQWSD